MSIAKKLEIARVARNMTLQDISDRSGVSISSIKGISAGVTPNPSFETICKIATAMKLDANWFMDDINKLPMEILDLPPELNTWLLNQDRMGYIRLAHDMEKNEIPLEVAQKLIKDYLDLMKMSKKSDKKQ